MIYVIVGLVLFVVFVIYPCVAMSSMISREEEKEW